MSCSSKQRSWFGRKSAVCVEKSKPVSMKRVVLPLGLVCWPRCPLEYAYYTWWMNHPARSTKTSSVSLSL